MWWEILEGALQIFPLHIVFDIDDSNDHLFSLSETNDGCDHDSCCLFLSLCPSHDDLVPLW